MSVFCVDMFSSFFDVQTVTRVLPFVYLALI